MAAFYDYFNEKNYADAVKNVSVPGGAVGETYSSFSKINQFRF